MRSEIAHLVWSETRQESVEGVVDHVEVIGVRRHRALFLEGYVVGETRSLMHFQMMELKWREEVVG